MLTRTSFKYTQPVIKRLQKKHILRRTTSRRGQISTFKSYMGSDKRGTTAAGWYASIIVDNTQDSIADETEDSVESADAKAEIFS